MSEILSRDDLIVTVNRLMISAMGDIDAGRNDAGDATLALVLEIEDHDRALRAEYERLREALKNISEETTDYTARSIADAALAEVGK